MGMLSFVSDAVDRLQTEIMLLRKEKDALTEAHKSAMFLKERVLQYQKDELSKLELKNTELAASLASKMGELATTTKAKTDTEAALAELQRKTQAMEHKLSSVDTSHSELGKRY